MAEKIRVNWIDMSPPGALECLRCGTKHKLAFPLTVDDFVKEFDAFNAKHAACLHKSPLDWYADVLAFHRKFGCKVGTAPAVPDDATKGLRKALVDEEIAELHAAMEANDLPGVADAIVDSIYVLLGYAITYGIDVRPVWEAVHAANMAKEGGATREDGKILKPPGWVAPDVAGIIRQQTKSVED